MEHFVGSTGGIGTRNGPGSEARFLAPGVVVGNSKYLFLTDGGTTIRRISRATHEVTTIAVFESGAGALWADEGSLYVAEADSIFRLNLESGELVAIIQSSNGPIKSIWADGESVYALDSGTFTRTWGPLGILTPKTPATILQFSLRTGGTRSIPIPNVDPNAAIQPAPTGMVGDREGLYLGYGSGAAVGIGRLNLATLQFQPLTPLPPKPAANAGYPRSLSLDNAGSLYFIGDENNGRTSLRRLNLTNAEVTTMPFAAPGAVVNLGPRAVWSDGGGIFVSDAESTLVAAIQPDGLRVSIVAGSPSTAIDGAWPRLATNPFVEPPFPSEQLVPDVLWGADSTIYAVYLHAIYGISIPTGEIRHIAGVANEPGSGNGLGQAARFRSPNGLWGDGRHLYVADSEAIRKIDLTTDEVSDFASISARGIWGDGAWLYASHEGAVSRIELSTGSRETLVQLTQPGALWGDGIHLFVLDIDAPVSRIRRIRLDNREASTVSTFASFPDARGFSFPRAIWGRGRTLFVGTGQTLSSVDALTGEMRTLAGDPAAYGTENGMGNAARFMSIKSLWSDERTIYIADESLRKAEFTTGIISFSLPNAGTFSWTTDLDGPQGTSYARMQPSAANPTPEGVAVFSLRENGVLISETAVAAGSLIQSGRIHAEINGAVNTGLAIANPGDEPATLSFYFTDADGRDLAGAPVTIAANAQIAAFLGQLPFHGNSSARSMTFTSSRPVAAIALRGFVNERSEFLMTTLPVAPLNETSNEGVVLPHFVAGGGWSTHLLLVNPSDAIIAGRVRFFGTAGDEEVGRAYTIPARSSVDLDVQQTDGLVRTGSIRIHPDAGNIAPIASTVFSFVSRGVTVTQNGVAQPVTGRAVRIYAATLGVFGQPGSISTGFALANTVSNPATVTLELTDEHGAVQATATITLPANGQRSMFLHEITEFSGLPSPFSGILRMSTNSAVLISAIGLRGRYNERGDFLIVTTPSLNEEKTQVHAERIFPHIVNGGGYSTQFMLMSRTATSGHIRFFLPGQHED